MFQHPQLQEGQTSPEQEKAHRKHTTMSAAVQGDPRRPRETHSFVREAIEASKSLADYYSIISLLLGIVGFSLKWKSAAWASFIFCGAAFANTKNGEGDVRQLSWAIMTATSSIVSSYSSAYQEATTAYSPPSDLSSPANLFN